MMNKSELDDKEHTEEDRTEFTRLFLNFRNDIFRIFLSYLRNESDAWDVFQSSYLHGLKKSHLLDHQEHFLVWITRIGKRIAFDLRKDRKRDEEILRLLYEDRYEELWELAMKYNPEEETMDEEKRRIFYEALDLLDDECRLTFELRFGQKLCIQDVAKATEVAVSTVHYRLDKIKEIMSRRMNRLCCIAIASHVSTDRILAMTIQAIDKASESYPELAAFTTGTTAAALGATGGTSAGVVTTTTGSASTGTAFSIAAVLALFGSIFFWIVSVLIGVRIWGTAVVLDTPIPTIRRWLIKHFMIAYCGIVFSITLPVYLFMSRFMTLQSVTEFFSVMKWAVLALSGFYLFWLRRRYRSLVLRSDMDTWAQGDIVSRPLLRRIVRGGLLLTSGLITGCLGVFLFRAVREIHNAFQFQTTSRIIICAILLAAVTMTVLVFHIGTSRQFLRFLSLSNDDPSDPPSGAAVRAPAKPRRFKATDLAFVVCCLLTLAPSAIHLILHRTRMFYAVAELALFSVLWFLIWLWNYLSEENRGMRIVLMLIGQLIVLVVLRELLWTPIM